MKARPSNSKSSFVVLSGSQRDLLPASRRAGSIDAAEIASITVRTRSRGDIDDLKVAVDRIYAQPLATRVYYTRAQLAQEFGAVEDDLDAIERFAQTNNLMVSRRSAVERSLVLTGRLGNILKAFRANVHVYHHSTGTYRGRQGEILIPRAFENIITGIFGFDTRPRHKSQRRRFAASVDTSGPDNGWPPPKYAKRYNFPTKYGKATLDGTGQCIGIIELGGAYQHADLETYFGEMGIPVPSVTPVLVDGITPVADDRYDGEVLMDIEIAGAVAPGAKQVVYFAKNEGQNLLRAVNRAVHDAEYSPNAISISWGMPDDWIEQQQLKAFSEVFLEAAALGVTVCASSGDHGCADWEAANWDKQIHVNHPASDPYVLGCGGTQRDGDDDVVWNDGSPFDAAVQGGGGWTTGGGISPKFSVPSYQAKITLPKSLGPTPRGRGVPDISMSAVGYRERIDGQDDGYGGGTSAVSPMMAGLVVLLNQAKAKPVGFLNPFLYANASKGIVRPVTKGTNAITDSVKGYSAAKGWNACTGLGTPNGVNILKAL